MSAAARELIDRARLDAEAWALLNRAVNAWVAGYEAALREYGDPDLHLPRLERELLALEAIAKENADVERAALFAMRSL